ncbi:MAG: LVIVD repeat-containing protein, partial [Promethearchaeota archaeon]
MRKIHGAFFMKITNPLFVTSLCILLFLNFGNCNGAITHTNGQNLLLQKLGQFNDGGKVVTFQIMGDICYLADWFDGLEIIDISDPTSPKELGQYSTKYARGIQIADNVCFLSCNANGLLVLDISDPANPIKIGEYFDGGAAHGLIIKGDIGYLANWGNGIVILNLTNPYNLVKIGQFN